MLWLSLSVKLHCPPHHQQPTQIIIKWQWMMWLNRLCSTVVRDDVNNPVGILRSLYLNMVIGRVDFAHEEKIGETNFNKTSPKPFINCAWWYKFPSETFKKHWRSSFITRWCFLIVSVDFIRSAFSRMYFPLCDLLCICLKVTWKSWRWQEIGSRRAKS